MLYLTHRLSKDDSINWSEKYEILFTKFNKEKEERMRMEEEVKVMRQTMNQQNSILVSLKEKITKYCTTEV